MQRFNILVGCDQLYYDDWAIELFKSTHYHNPWIELHCHIVNPSNNVSQLEYVDYTFETKDFLNNEAELAYLQMVRFLAVANKFQNDELVITLDADSICTKAIDHEEFSALFDKQYVLQHHKELRWLAGFVVFNSNGFRNEYARELLSIPLEDLRQGRDQLILNQLSSKFNFCSLNTSWMSIGKNKNNSVFLTLKGNQKNTDKYLKIYNDYKVSR